MVCWIAVVIEWVLFQYVQVLFAIEIDERIFEHNSTIGSVHLMPDKTACDAEIRPVETETIGATVWICSEKLWIFSNKIFTFLSYSESNWHHIGHI